MALLRIALAAVMVLGRLLPFLIVGVLLFLLRRRSLRKGEGPEFKGPVITVDYEDVPEKDGDGEA